VTDAADGLTPRDTEQLRLLVIGHYVVAGIKTVLGCMGDLHQHGSRRPHADRAALVG
jgi:hypothetical protein